MTTSIRKVKTSDLELKDRLVSIQRVTKVTKGGRTFSFSAIAGPTPCSLSISSFRKIIKTL